MIQIRIPFYVKDKNISNIISEYSKRIRIKFEIRSSSKLLENLSSSDYLIAMSPDGETLSSKSFANLLEKKMSTHKNIIFFIGEAEGLTNDVIEKSNYLISFGKQTWPHQLCTAMLVEQIYRAQQIINNHPYDK